MDLCPNNGLIAPHLSFKFQVKIYILVTEIFRKLFLTDGMRQETVVPKKSPELHMLLVQKNNIF